MTIYAVEGIDYSGKSTASEILKNDFGCKYFIASPEEKNRIHNLPAEERFWRFLELNEALYAKAMNGYKKGDNIIIERLWASTIAYHNVLLGKRLQENPDVFQRILKMKPDEYIFIETDIAGIKRRMQKSPPAHIYEDDAYFLMDVQKELRRVVDFAYEKMRISFLRVENINDDAFILKKNLELLTLIMSIEKTI